jgi:hypothetical protein
MTQTLRICLWSTPRTVSTALMYSFAQRQDTRVVDEPFYAAYLRASGAQHPGREEILAAQDDDGANVIRNVVLGDCDRPVLFMKHMAHHMPGVDLGFVHQVENAFLIRDPAEMLRSVDQVVSHPTLRDVGLDVQCELYDAVAARGKEPPVIDSRELLRDPAGVLGQLCERLGLAFDEVMLRWPAGGRPEDGVWSPYWYGSLHRSTGFAPHRPKTGAVPEHLEPLLATCRPYYERLYRHALRAGD